MLDFHVRCYLFCEPMDPDPMAPVNIDGETVSWSCESEEGHRYESVPKIIITLKEYKSITDEICKINRLGYHMEMQYLCGDCIESIIKSGDVKISEAAKTYFDRVADKNSLFAIYFSIQIGEKSYLSLHPVIDKRQVLLSDLKNSYNFLEVWKKHGYTLPEDIKASGRFDFEAIEYLTGIKVE